MATTVTDPSLEPTPPSAPGTAPRARRPGTHHRGESQQQLGQRPGRPRSRRSDIVNMLFGRKIRTDQEIHERLGKPHRAGGVRQRRPLVGGLRHRGDPHASCCSVVGRRSRSATLRPADRSGIVALLVILMFSLPPDDQGVPDAPVAPTSSPSDNFGLLPAQVAGVALLTDYILTVAVSVAAGVAALYSAFPALVPVPGADRGRASSAIIACGNLRGVKESGRSSPSRPTSSSSPCSS